MLREAGLTVTEIGDYTGFPEMLDGRVKTLHPKVHGGILARRDLPEHMATIEQHGIPLIDLVCVNLYPFAATIAKAGVTLEDAIENIDIGGPAMVRSSAKNYAGVAIVTDPEDYAPLLDEMKANGGALQLATRFGLAKKAFTHTARYDSMIANWLTGLDEGAEAKPGSRPDPGDLPGQAATGLRPHRNPALRRKLAPERRLLPRHQPARRQHRRLHPVAGQGTVLQQHRRLRCRLGMRQNLRRPGLRHRQARQPVRRGIDGTLLGAYEKAFKTDSTSAFGGIIAFNGEVGIDVVNAMNERKHFVEVLIAPSFTAEAKAALASKQNLRVLVVPISHVLNALEFKRVGGGLLVQTPDDFTAQASGLKIVTKVQPTAQQIEDLLFAERVAKFVKSNAIVFCGNGMTLGVGAGQMSRVDSTKIASIKAQHAGLDLTGSVVASDAFFPFRDGVDVLAAAGAKAVIQPGGSMRDEEVIAAADEHGHGLAMVFTGFGPAISVTKLKINRQRRTASR
jgi:phosphoribosylaminoimidazolecarboxamide formyltransferase/IMP cyclohydrolase